MEKPLKPELKHFLAKGLSRSGIDALAHAMSGNPLMWQALWEIYFELEEPFSRKAAWVLDTASESDSGKVLPYLQDLIQKLPHFGHDGLKRHALRMIARNPFPANGTGPLMDICFKWLLEPLESVAVKMFCMQILVRLAEDETDILQELYDTIEFQMDNGSAGYVSIGRKTMQEIDRQLIKLRTAKP